LQTNEPLLPKQSKGLGRLARRISAWTTNSLLTVMLAVVAVGFGREVLHWWHEGTLPAGATGVAADPLGDEAAPHVLEFGDHAWSIRRQVFSGRQSDVSAALEAACRAAMVDSRPGRESADSTEQELLKRLACQRPVAEEHGQWRIYRWGGGYSVLIGTRALGRTRLDAGRSVEGATAPGPGTNLDETVYRVVIWGVAVPTGVMPGTMYSSSRSANVWALYLFQSGGGASGQLRPEMQIPLPPAGHRLVSIRAAVGGAITAFSAGDGDAARGFYDRWFADHGWKIAIRWQQIASGWHGRFESPSAPAQAVDIHLGIDSQGRSTALMMESQLGRAEP